MTSGRDIWTSFKFRRDDLLKKLPPLYFKNYSSWRLETLQNRKSTKFDMVRYSANWVGPANTSFVDILIPREVNNFCLHVFYD